MFSGTVVGSIISDQLCLEYIKAFAAEHPAIPVIKARLERIGIEGSGSDDSGRIIPLISRRRPLSTQRTATRPA
jgi:hypothetical protein